MSSFPCRGPEASSRPPRPEEILWGAGLPASGGGLGGRTPGQELLVVRRELTRQGTVAVALRDTEWT